jgi:hypothetical protein
MGAKRMECGPSLFGPRQMIADLNQVRRIDPGCDGMAIRRTGHGSNCGTHPLRIMTSTRSAAPTASAYGHSGHRQSRTKAHARLTSVRPRPGGAPCH